MKELKFQLDEKVVFEAENFAGNFCLGVGRIVCVDVSETGNLYKIPFGDNYIWLREERLQPLSEVFKFKPGDVLKRRNAECDYTIIDVGFNKTNKRYKLLPPDERSFWVEEKDIEERYKIVSCEKFKVGDIVSRISNEGELKTYKVLLFEFDVNEKIYHYKVVSTKEDNNLKLWFSEDQLSLVLRQGDSTKYEIMSESNKEQKEIYKPTLIPLFEGGAFTVLNITDDNSKLFKLLKLESEFFEEFEVSLYTQRFVYSHSKDLDAHFWVEEENSSKTKEMEAFISGFIRGLEVK